MVHLFLLGKEGVKFWPKWRYVIYEQPLAFQVTISLTTTVANLLKSLLMEILVKYWFQSIVKYNLWHTGPSRWMCLYFKSYVIFSGRLSGAHQYRLPSLASWTGRSGHGQVGHTDVRQPTKSHCFVVWPAPVRPAIHCRSAWECSEGQAGLPQTNGQQSGLSRRRIQGPFAANCLHSSEAASGKIFFKTMGIWNPD